MADSLFYQNIEKSTAHRPVRDVMSGQVFENPELLKELIAVALDTNDKNHYKACWILELVLEKNMVWLKPYLDRFCEALPLYLHDGAVRSISKICWFASVCHMRSKDFLTESQLQQITESCFDWLISDAKVASKAYAMRALFENGKIQPWIYPEMKSILELGYPNHSAAYQAAAKELLKKMK